MNEYDIDAAVAATATLDDVLMYWPDSTAESQQFSQQIQEAFGLARSGALYAARRPALSIRYDKSRCFAIRPRVPTSTLPHWHRALAALDEANDFASAATATGASGTNLPSLAAAHRTPVLVGLDPAALLPHEAIALYHRYAERKFAAALAGDPAASMALFGLGKVYAHMADRDGHNASLRRRCVTMYRASSMVREDNPLASNELGVLLVRGGRVAQARPHLLRAVQLAPTASHLHNLAVVEGHLGNVYLAAQLARRSREVASHELASGQVAQRRGVAWVSPEQFNRTSDSKTAEGPRPAEQRAPTPVAARSPSQGSNWRFERVKATAPATDEPRRAAPPIARRPGHPSLSTR